MIERARERFGIKLTHADVARLSDRIACGEGVAFDVPSVDGTGRGFLIRLESGQILPVVYVAGVGCTTVLPHDATQLRRAVMLSAMRGKERPRRRGGIGG